MSPFIAEFVGTMFLITIGNGVVANVVLDKTKGNNSGWIVITIAWAMAVFIGVYAASHGSDAHLNPAVTIAMACFKDFKWTEVPVYLAGQMCGAMLGSLLVYFSYKQHYDETKNADLILATFSTSPAIKGNFYNLITEVIGSFFLIFGVLFIAKPGSSLGALDALPVALLVLAIGLGLGGPTGYAINPARDLGPRIVHAMLPMKNKGGSNWGYSWIPVIGPIIGGVIAAMLFKLFIHLK